MTEDDPLGYSYRVLLPIWGRWTEGHRSMLRALDCASADPRTHQERREALMAAVTLLMVEGHHIGVAAAVPAGLAVLAALDGDTGDGYDQLCRRAVDADREALDRSSRA